MANSNAKKGDSDGSEYKQSIKNYEFILYFAKQAGDTDTEGVAYINLGVFYHKLGDYKQCIEYSELALRNGEKLGNRDRKGCAYCNLGSGYKGLGDLNRAMEYYKLGLDIAKGLENRELQAAAYRNLGAGHQQLGDLKKAVEYYLGGLEIVKKAGDTNAEGELYKKLSASYGKLSEYKKCIEYSELALHHAKEQGDRNSEGIAYGDLGVGYSGIGDLKRAIEYHKLRLEIANELGDRHEEANANCNLGIGHLQLGDFEQAVKYHLCSLDISKQMGDRTGEGRAYANLGGAYYVLGNIKEAMQYHQLSLEIAKKEGDREVEGSAYGIIGLLHSDLLDFKQGIEYQKKYLHISKEMGKKSGEGRACLNLGNGYRELGDLEQAKKYSQRALELFQEAGDMEGVAKGYHGCGACSERLGNIDEALLFYKASTKQYNEMRRLLQSKDEWNINFRSQYQTVYNSFQNLLLMQKKIVEALSTAEYGRAQALEDLLHSQYGLEAVQSDEIELGSTEMVIYTKSPVLYVSVQGNVIKMWLLQEGEVALFTVEQIDANQLKSNDAADLKSFIHNTVKNISAPSRSGYRCEDRTLDDCEETDVGTLREETDGGTLREETDVGTLREETDVGTLREETPEELVSPELCAQNIKSEDLSILYDVTVGAVADLIHGIDLIIVPDGPLFLAPFAAIVDPKSGRYLGESLRIRILPSLTSLKMILLAPRDYHSTRGALIVGDPCLEKIVKRRGRPAFPQLKCAREEAKMVGSILNVKPLIGKDATKEEVLKRLNTVALVHIAAHGDSKTGEIALAPNPSADSKVPKKDNYMLTMAEVLDVGLRARLVVLSCCNSGRGEIKAEGVVGISRAFLGAGARSVLVSLWAIEDEATLEFMRSFYQHLVDGNSASESLDQAMKGMRESQKFNAVKHWAPFVLIGDDVTMNFNKETDHAPNVGAAETQTNKQDEEDSVLIMERMTNTINILKEGRYSDFGPVFAQVYKDVLQPYRKTSDQQLRQKYGDHLSKIGAPAQLTMFLRRLIDIGMETEKGWMGMRVIRSTIWNYSDASLKMASALGQSGALEMMLNDLDTYGPQQSENKKKSFLVSSALGILQNCAKASENRQMLCNLRAVERIAPFLKAEDMEVVMTALLTLSYITTDEQKDVLEADNKDISYLLDMLRKSLDQSDLKESGWSALEVAVGLGNIAANEKNRETMIDREAISLLVSLIIKGGDTEKECAANALWVLVKDSSGKAKFKETPEAMEELSRLSTSGNHSVQEAANRVLIALKETAEGTIVDAAETQMTNQEDFVPIMNRMTNTINILKEGRYSDIGSVIGTVFEDVLQPYTETSDRQLRQKYGDHLCEIGAPAQLTMFLRRLIGIGMETEKGWAGMYVVRSTFLNYSDASLKMASALGQSGALEMMLNDLDTYGLHQSEDEKKSHLVSSAVGILHNCAKACENRPIFCNSRAVERIAPFLQAEDMEVALLAILTLSYITSDEQKELLEADSKVISYILGKLRNCLDQSDLRGKTEDSTWSALKIAVGLGNLAKNESNRETMIDREAISLLVSLIIKGGDNEKEYAANALWVLVKDSRGKAKFMETPEAMEELSRLSTSGNHSVQEAANRVIIALKETAEVTRDDRVEECLREEQVLPD